MKYGCFKNALLLVLLSSSCAFAEEERHVLSLGANYSFLNSGYVRVREWEVRGDHLELDDDLGIDSTLGLDLAIGFKIGEDWLDLAHSELRYQGRANFASTFEFNGAVYAAGPTDINETSHRRTSLIYNKTTSGARTAQNYTSFGVGLVLETLKFSIDGELDASTTRYEKHESFARQLVPVPAVAFRHYRPLLSRYKYGFDVTAAWMPKIKTHYVEGGSIYFTQYNLDAKAEIVAPWRGLEVGAGYQFKYFHQIEESNEDTNKFELMTSSLGVNFKYFF